MKISILATFALAAVVSAKSSRSRTRKCNAAKIPDEAIAANADTDSASVQETQTQSISLKYLVKTWERNQSTRSGIGYTTINNLTNSAQVRTMRDMPMKMLLKPGICLDQAK